MKSSVNLGGWRLAMSTRLANRLYVANVRTLGELDALLITGRWKELRNFGYRTYCEACALVGIEPRPAREAKKRGGPKWNA
jgi:hypothetical protein